MTVQSLTSTILLAEVGEPPDVAEPDAEPEDGEEELDGAVPGGSLGPALLHLLHHRHLLSSHDDDLVPPSALVTDWTLPCAPSTLLPPLGSESDNPTVKFIFLKFLVDALAFLCKKRTSVLAKQDFVKWNQVWWIFCTLVRRRRRKYSTLLSFPALKRKLGAATGGETAAHFTSDRLHGDTLPLSLDNWNKQMAQLWFQHWIWNLSFARQEKVYSVHFPYNGLTHITAQLDLTFTLPISS